MYADKIIEEIEKLEESLPTDEAIRIVCEKYNEPLDVVSDLWWEYKRN
jgi:hypothetical protein